MICDEVISSQEGVTSCLLCEGVFVGAPSGGVEGHCNVNTGRGQGVILQLSKGELTVVARLEMLEPRVPDTAVVLSEQSLFWANSDLPDASPHPKVTDCLPPKIFEMPLHLTQTFKKHTNNQLITRQTSIFYLAL